jgi:hypothetical protein
MNEDELRDDFEFWIWRRSGGWPTRNSLGQYKKRRTEEAWQVWLTEADKVPGSEETRQEVRMQSAGHDGVKKG